ncbi:MAG: HAD family hydrolase [Euzebyales bacterium]|jgi:HAD superfamily hydrolase (TIGR01490 family)|nr:HAD family hydrolase [Euzebyales bacterium]
MAQARAAAFFDLDKTVVAKSSTLAFSRPLYREGLISPAIVLKGAYAQLAYQLFGANDERMDRSRVALLQLTVGWEADRVQRLIRETLQEVIDPIVYAEALELFDEHRRADRDLYLVSSSGVEVVTPLAEYLGVPYVIATRPGVDGEGRYDGTLEFYCYGEHKAVAIREEAERRGIDLCASYAYSDSITDVPMLAAVGHPVTVNPDRRLREIGSERGWECRDFVRPVPVRSRLRDVPRPPGEVVAGAGALGMAALAGWVVYQRRQQAPRGRRANPAPAALSSSRAGSGSGRRRRSRASWSGAGRSSGGHPRCS